MSALEQKVAIVTGATSGIGAAMAALFAAEGADVVIAGRRLKEGEELAETLGAAFFATDVTVESDVEALVGYAVDRFGRLDVMVNNAGAAGAGGGVVLGWQSVFLINVPVGLAALALAPRLVPESRAENPARLDLVGALLISSGLVALVLPLTEGRQDGWPLWAWISLASVPLLFGLFTSYEKRLACRGGAPLLPPDLFRERAFSAGLTTQLALWCGQASFFLVLSLYLQQGRGLNALQAGLVFSILAVAFVATSLRAPDWMMRHGRRVIATGAVILAVGDGLLLACVSLIGTRGSVAVLAPGLLLVGAGQGLCITPITATVLSSLDPQRAGAAAGVLSTVQQVGNALGVAITGVIFFSALNGGFAHAFTLSLAELAALLLGVAALTRLLPARKAP